MTNWFYNEVEMMDKHKMLNGAGAKYQQSGKVNRHHTSALSHRFVILLGRLLVDAGRSLLNRFEPAPDQTIVPQTGKAK